MVLTDTFHLYEQEKDMIANLLPDNSERRTAQKERDIRIIMANPPYSKRDNVLQMIMQQTSATEFG